MSNKLPDQQFQENQQKRLANEKKIQDLTDNRRKKLLELQNISKKPEDQLVTDEDFENNLKKKRENQATYIENKKKIIDKKRSDFQALNLKKEKEKENEISTLGGRHIYNWRPSKDYSGPPMKIFEGDPNENKSQAAINIATFNRLNRGDLRSEEIEQDGLKKYFYTPDTIKRDQAFADGESTDPITGQPNKGWLFRKFAGNVDRSSPYIVQNSSDQPSPISPGDVKDGGEKSTDTQQILNNLTSSLNLDKISPARAAEEVITYLVGPMQRTVEDASSQIAQWENQAYTAFGVPNTGQGFVRDFLTSQLYATATQVIYDATSMGDPEMNDPKKAAARTSLIRLALVRDKQFRMKVDDIVNRIIYQVTEVFNDGFDLITGIFPVVGDIAGIVKDVIQQGSATTEQIADGLEAYSSVNNIIEATNQPIPNNSNSSGGGAKMMGGGINIKENYNNNLFDLFAKKYMERTSEISNQKGGSKNKNIELNNLVSEMVSQPLSHVTGSDNWQIILSDTTKRISSVINDKISNNNSQKKGGKLTRKKGILLKYKNKNGRFTKSIKVHN
jgi:hypothetical protein